jgi:hypothetical protein
MNRDLRLIMLKRLVNIPVRLLDLLLPSDPEVVHFPQTKMLQQLYARIFKVYHLDCLQGTFGKHPDGNFERLLRVSCKILVRIGEDDPYYRKWVGLGFLLAADEWAGRVRDPKRLKQLIKEQWHMNINCLPDELIAAYADDFAEDALCDFLGNLLEWKLETQLP